MLAETAGPEHRAGKTQRGHAEAAAGQDLHQGEAPQDGAQVSASRFRLEFQAGSEEELLAFCEYVGQAVLSREKMLRGDLVSEFLVDRLQECEKLALGSNSEVERAEASLVWEGGSRENLELLLNSAIKQPQGQSAVSQNIRYSISSLQNLSELIGASGQ